VNLDTTSAAEAVAAATLVAGLVWASATDLKEREAPDAVWQILAVAGVVIGLVVAWGTGTGAVLLWVLVSVLVLEHLFNWDERLEGRGRLRAWQIEAALYVGVGLVLLYTLIDASSSVSLSAAAPALAVYVTVLFARGLFEARVLYGGADAKALMTAGLLIPFWTMPLLPLPSSATAVLVYLPFAFSMLLNAALLALSIPIAIAIRNLVHREFEFPRGFVSYKIPVAELPQRFVWLRDPTFSADPEVEDVETAEEDRQLRIRQMQDLEARGVRRVWVTPQVPFIVVLAVGAGATLLAGNLILDLFALI
jgi:archaeal preflagellin peptidase FlaK